MRKIGISAVLTMAVCATVLIGILLLLYYVPRSTTTLAEDMAQQTMRQMAASASQALDRHAAKAMELAGQGAAIATRVVDAVDTVRGKALGLKTTMAELGQRAQGLSGPVAEIRDDEQQIALSA